MPGRRSMLSFVLGAVACAFAGLCYAEMASSVPICGSAYTYAYATLGELVAWIIGWDLILEYAVAAVAVAVGWSAYVVSFPGISASSCRGVVSAPFDYDATPGSGRDRGILNLPAMLVIVAVTALLVVGISESARVNNIIVAMKCGDRALHRSRALVEDSNWVTPGNPAAPSSRRTPHRRFGVRRDPRRRGGVLRLCRVRRGLDRGAGGRDRNATCRSASSARSRSARALHRGGLCADRHRAIRQAECAGSDRGRHRYNAIGWLSRSSSSAPCSG